MSRGIESIPAVFVFGSTVSKINVSVQNGQSASVGSPPRSPTNKILMRLAPSQIGYSISSGTRDSGVEVESGLFCLLTKTGAPSGLPAPLPQLAGAIPGSDVRRQQRVKARTSMKSPAPILNAIAQKAICRIKNWRVSLLGILRSLLVVHHNAYNCIFVPEQKINDYRQP